MVASPPRKSHSESFAGQPSVRRPALPMGVPSSRNLEASDAHQRARTLYGRERAPSKPHGVRPASVRGPWSRHRLENPTAKALRAQPLARRPPAARESSVITEPRGAIRPPARTHAVGPGTRKSGGRPYALAKPRSRAPSKLHGVRPASVGAHGLLSRRVLPTGWGPYRTTRSASTPGSPHIVCSGTTRTCKNRGPPPLPFREGRRRIGRGGETPPPLPFSKALCGVPRSAPSLSSPPVFKSAMRRAQARPQVVAAYMRAGWRAPARALAPAWLRQPRVSRQSVLPF